MVNDLLDVSRMELNTKHREIVDVDIFEVVNQAIDLLEFEIKKKEISVEVNIQKDLPLLKMDKDEAVKIINNILSNAVKYNKDKGEIKIEAKTIVNNIVIEIADTGIGLREEDKNKLFQQFFRVKNKYTRTISGTGLGLSIVKRLVEANHGKIDVESVYDEGTKILIHFPYK